MPLVYYLQGDVVAIYDTNGSKIVEYAYDAWGNCTIVYSTNDTLANDNPIRYRGYYLDIENNFYYLNSRYYSPEFRRFISPADANALNPHMVNGLNLYCYSNNNPIDIIDGDHIINNTTLIRNSYNSNILSNSNNTSYSYLSFSDIFSFVSGAYNNASTMYGLYVSGSTILNNLYFISNIKPFADDMKMIGVSSTRGVLSFNNFNWKMGKGDFVALGINVFSDMYDSYQRGVSTEGILLGGAMTTATGVGLLYANKLIMSGATALGSYFGPAGTVVGFVVGGVVCIFTDLFLSKWLDIEEWIDSIAK